MLSPLFGLKSLTHRMPFCRHLHKWQWKFTLCKQPHVDPIADIVPQPRQATGFSTGQAMPNFMLKRSHLHRHPTSPKTLSLGLCACQWLCTLMLMLSLLLAFSSEATVYARSGPTRRDRRPDREVRICYPRSQPQPSNPSNNGQSNHSQSNGTVLQNSPAAPATPSTSENASSSSPTE